MENGWFQNLFSLQGGGALVRSISASKNIATKTGTLFWWKKTNVFQSVLQLVSNQMFHTST